MMWLRPWNSQTTSSRRFSTTSTVGARRSLPPTFRPNCSVPSYAVSIRLQPRAWLQPMCPTWMTTSDRRSAIPTRSSLRFKVHRMQSDMARLLTDSNGDLKPFNQWANDVLPIASHQCGAWLRTEYDTAVVRAHQAADWQQFLREADVLPNLKWMPSTSPNPGADHQLFWNTVRPINDPFWNEHRPGDRWNCKCSLTSTDEPCTAALLPTRQATRSPDSIPILAPTRPRSRSRIRTSPNPAARVLSTRA